MGIYVNISSTLIPNNTFRYANQIQEMSNIFELFLKYPDVAQFRWLCTHEHLHENDDGGIQHVLLKIYAFGPPHQIIFTLYSYLSFLTAFNNTGWSFSTNFHVYYRKYHCYKFTGRTQWYLDYSNILYMLYVI